VPFAASAAGADRVAPRRGAARRDAVATRGGAAVAVAGAHGRDGDGDLGNIETEPT